jgi:hypothetical protein
VKNSLQEAGLVKKNPLDAESIAKGDHHPEPARSLFC